MTRWTAPSSGDAPADRPMSGPASGDMPGRSPNPRRKCGRGGSQPVVPAGAGPAPAPTSLTPSRVVDHRTVLPDPARRALDDTNGEDADGSRTGARPVDGAEVVPVRT